MNNKTLLISYTLPPSPTGSATVIGNLLRQFTGDEIVIAGAKNHGIQTCFDWENSPKIKYVAWRTRPFRGAGIIRLLLMPITFFLSLFYYKKFDCKNVIAIYPNNEFFIMGWLVAKITRANFFPYLHNTFADGKKRPRLSKKIFDTIEKNIFLHSKKILLLSDGLAAFYKEKYGDHFSYEVIRHTYNEKIDTQFEAIPYTEIAKYAMVGSINESNRDASIRLIHSIHSIHNSQVLLRSGTHQMHLKSAGLYDTCKIIPELPRSQLFELLNSAEALLLPHGFQGGMSSVEYKTIFPTKTIEYLLSGRPIIAHCPEDCFLSAFLKKYNCALIISDKDTNTIIGKLKQFRGNTALHREMVINAKKAAEEFEALKVSNILKEALRINNNLDK